MSRALFLGLLPLVLPLSVEVRPEDDRWVEATFARVEPTFVGECGARYSRTRRSRCE